jgi:hypothetical protein
MVGWVVLGVKVPMARQVFIVPFWKAVVVEGKPLMSVPEMAMTMLAEQLPPEVSGCAVFKTYCRLALSVGDRTNDGEPVVAILEPRVPPVAGGTVTVALERASEKADNAIQSVCWPPARGSITMSAIRETLLRPVRARMTYRLTSRRVITAGIVSQLCIRFGAGRRRSPDSISGPTLSQTQVTTHHAQRPKFFKTILRVFNEPVVPTYERLPGFGLRKIQNWLWDRLQTDGLVVPLGFGDSEARSSWPRNR